MCRADLRTGINNAGVCDAGGRVRFLAWLWPGRGGGGRHGRGRGVAWATQVARQVARPDVVYV